MSTLRLLWVGAAVMSLLACGKARELASKAKQAAESGVSAALGSASSQAAADPRLQALVDQTEEGALFRKDLPFPASVQVKMERRQTFDNARMVVRSAIGNQAAAISGTRFFTSQFERAGDRVGLTLESAGFSHPELAAGTDAKKANAEQAKLDQAAAAAAVPDALTALKELNGCKVSFLRRGNTWRPEVSNDFKLTVWGSNLAPHLEANGIDAGIMPRPYWFGQRRLKPGDSVPLSGTALTLLLGKGASGNLELKLESFEASGSHPCGVFSVSGSYHEVAVPGPDGMPFDHDVSISSGKIWLSLVYPLVVREELETVQTIAAGARSGHSMRIQGRVAVATSREWKGL